MEYISLDSLPYYAENKTLVAGLGFLLVELRVMRSGGNIHVSAVITRSARRDGMDTGSSSISIDDCAKVHRLLLSRMEALLQNDDISMEVTSPGLERNIKNAAEFALFEGRPVRVWHTAVTEWVRGIIVSSDSLSLTIELLTEDGACAAERKTIPYSEIAKAKLLNL